MCSSLCWTGILLLSIFHPSDFSDMFMPCILFCFFFQLTDLCSNIFVVVFRFHHSRFCFVFNFLIYEVFYGVSIGWIALMGTAAYSSPFRRAEIASS